MTEVVELVLSAALQIYISYWVIRRDERQLSGVAWDRGFPAATFWSAVVVFGPLSIPIHFIRTRRSWAGLGLGMLWFSAALSVIALAGFSIELFLE